MAVTFPLDLFDRYRFLTTSFLQDMRQSYSRDGAGRLTVVDYRMPIWRASFATPVIQEDVCIAIETELAMLRGGVNAILATDTRRPYPVKGPQSAVYGSAQVSAIDYPGNAVSFSGLPPGLVLSVGDRFSIIVGGVHLLFAIAEQRTVTGAGTTASAAVTPQIPLGITAPIAAKFANPTCTMKVAPGTVAFNASGGALGTVSFEAEQF